MFNLLGDDLKVKPKNIFFSDPDDILQIKKVISEIGSMDICFNDVEINGNIDFNGPPWMRKR